MKRTAIVLAGGRGRRMSSDVAKQYLPVGGKPMLLHSLDCFENSEYIDEIILVLPENEIAYVKENILKDCSFTKLRGITAGGKERYESVMNALSLVDKGIVFIHDGARPFVTEDILRRLWECVLENKACAAAVPVIDTIKRTDGEAFVEETVDRSTLWQIQTPQVFEISLIKTAYETFFNAGCTSVTDDCMLMELYSKQRVKLVMGSYENIKLTTPVDMLVAEEIFKARSKKLV